MAEQDKSASPAQAQPARDAKGNLTRAGMEQVIREGGSVLHKGQLHARVETLPSEAELAEGDEQATTQVLDGIRRQREQLDQQERKLLASKSDATARSAKAADEDADADSKSRRKH